MSRDRIKSIVSGMALNKGAELESIRKIEKELNFVFPYDFKKFLLISNGATGEIDGDYLELWAVEEIPVSNRVIEIKKYAPGLVAFGGDGALCDRSNPDDWNGVRCSMGVCRYV